MPAQHSERDGDRLPDGRDVLPCRSGPRTEPVWKVGHGKGQKAPPLIPHLLEPALMPGPAHTLGPTPPGLSSQTRSSGAAA